MVRNDALRQRLRVAVFLIVSVLVLVAAALALGHSQNLFSRKATLHTSFVNAGGLMVGSEVRLAGVVVGVLGRIYFFPDQVSQRVGIDLSVRASSLEWIRKNSVAQITSKGLLGDAVVDISVGSQTQVPLKDGDALASAEPAGMGQLVAGLGGTLQRINTLASDVDERLRLVASDQVAADLARLVHSAADIAEGVEHGPGLAHALILIPLSHEVSHAVAQIDSSAVDIQAGSRALQQTLVEVRTGQGLLHELVYNPQGKEMVRDLSQTARVVRQLAVETNEGKGTIGGLLKDPSIYEDLTTILGRVKRNVLLKALVRFTIAKHEPETPAATADK